MPELLSERVITLEFTDLSKRRPIERPAKPLARAPGVHQSDILAHLARVAGKLKPGEKLEEEMPWRMALGVMWEEFYFSMIPNADWQPGEMTRDGISVNCDGLALSLFNYGSEVVDEHVSVLEETKCTEKKVRTGEEFLDEWMWMHQGRAYCHVYGPRIVRWVIMFYRGDWRGSGPVVKEFVVRFTEKEISQTWAMLVRSRDKVAEMIAKGERP